jgi:hypothetical protein
MTGGEEEGEQGRPRAALVRSCGCPDLDVKIAPAHNICAGVEIRIIRNCPSSRSLLLGQGAFPREE